MSLHHRGSLIFVVEYLREQIIVERLEKKRLKNQARFDASNLQFLKERQQATEAELTLLRAALAKATANNSLDSS